MIFKFLNRIVEKALSLWFDYIDVKVAEKRLKSLEKGKTKTVSAEEVYKELGL